MNLFPSPGLFAAFVAASVLLALTPGPDMAVYLARTFGGGRSHGFAALIGAISGVDITLAGAALRSSALQLMGSGIGSVPQRQILAAIRGLLEAAPAAGFKVSARALPLAEVATAWNAGDAQSRIVLVP